MKEIEFCEQNILLHPQGVLFWPDGRLAVVSDLHLEKGSYFAQHGQFIPPHDSCETLRKLIVVLENNPVERLLLLGDSFHDDHGFDRMNEREKQAFQQLCASYEIIWVTGNHDQNFVPGGVRQYDDITIQNIVFRHEHESGATHEISGHFHPKADLKVQGRRLSRPCFMHDTNKIIMPAFGVYTGGLNHTDSIFKDIFQDDLCLSLLGKDRLYTVPIE